MKMKKMNFVFLSLFVMLAGSVSLQAALTFSPPAPRTGETVTFTLSPSGTPVGSISWNFGDGSPVQSGPSLTVTHVYAAVGSYTVSASYFTTLNAAIPHVDQATVTVTDPRQVTFSPPQPKAGQAVAFTALNFYSSCIRWDFGDATIKNGAAAESHTYASAGSYTVHAYEECGNSYGAAVTLAVAETEVTPPPVTPTKPTLAVTFISLYFAGGKADVSVAKDFAGLQAFADIQVTGTGILQWQWLVDGMVVKSDTLAVSFDNKFSLDSGKVPGLPTSIPGRHLVTLRFQNPKIDFTIPVITYFVGLRGPAPVIRRVTPATLAPGAEYNLELEGAELTSGTEISFPAPLALLKKAIILSSTQARATVFVPPTAGNGAKAVTARNEYGQSSGPGQVTIVTRRKYLPDKTPAQAANSPASPAINQLKTIPRIMGQIDCYPYASPAFADARVQLITNDDQAISNAIVKVDGVLLACSGPTSPTYTATINLDVPLGHQFTVSVSVDGITYKGTGGKIDNIVQVVKPTNGSTINPLETPQIDFHWTYSSGIIEPVNFMVKFQGSWPNRTLISDSVTADHVSVSTSPILNSTGRLFVFLAKEYAPVIFEGLSALKCKVPVFQSLDRPQIELVVSDRKQVPPADSEQAIPPKPGPKPPLIGTASIDWFKEQLKKSPVITGGIDCYPYYYGSSASYAQVNIFVKKGGAPVSGAVVKVDGNVIPESSYTPGHYFAEPQLVLEPGHVFTIAVQIDGATYTGSGGKIDTIVHLTQPAHGSTIYFKKYSQFDCQWTFSNGPAQVHLYALYIGQPSNKGIFEQDLTADHVSIPTAPIPGAQGKLYFFLGRKYADIKFDGLLAFTSSVQVYQNFGQPQSVVNLSASTLEKAPLLKKTGTTPAQAETAQPLAGEFQTQLKTTPQLNGSITYYPNYDPDSPLSAYATFFLSKEGILISDAIIKVDGILVPPNTDMYPPVYYGCYGSFKSLVPWPTSIAVGHVTTISLTTNGTTYTGSGGTIDSFPQLVVPAEGTTISLQQTPYLNLQWTGAGGIVPVWLDVSFHGGGESIGLYHSQVYTDHMQVHLLQPNNSIPEGATGMITVSLTKEYSPMVMDGMMRFTSSLHVGMYRRFYLKLVP
jgi:PKD repeat protein